MQVVALLSVLSLGLLTNASPTPPTVQLDERQLYAAEYAPQNSQCPTTPLVRPATSTSADEQNYRSARSVKAGAALANWLAKHGDFSTSSQPCVALVSSGGGYRAMLETAGVMQAFDDRDSDSSVNGLYQAFTYHTALSGGSWFLGSLSGNDWPTVSYLRDKLWGPALATTLLFPANLFSIRGLTEYTEVVSDLTAKELAGYDTTIVDAWGRLLSYQFLQAPGGGVGIRLSDLASFSNFTDYNVPYPIMTALGVRGYQGQCTPSLNATQYEFHPYEYGSWDTGVSAFAQSRYMGSDIVNTMPKESGVCTVGYDNLGYVYGTSSNVFVEACAPLAPNNATLSNELQQLVPHKPLFQDLFALYKNPFYQYDRSPLVANDQELTLVDGGIGGQNDPIWPLIQPARPVDVMIVNDNSADTPDYFPNGTEIQQTYINAQAVGLTAMPFIPDVNTFVSQGLNKRATFFGCDEPDTTFIIFLPNVNYTFPSNQPTLRLQYDKDDTAGMIANGNQIATQNGDSGWPFCLACAIKHKDGNALPSGCNTCFDKYCYRQQTSSSTAGSDPNNSNPFADFFNNIFQP